MFRESWRCCATAPQAVIMVVGGRRRRRASVNMRRRATQESRWKGKGAEHRWHALRKRPKGGYGLLAHAMSGSVGNANPVGGPPKVGGSSANRRGVTLQLHRRVVLVAAVHGLPLPPPPEPMSGSVRNAKPVRVPPKVGGLSANRRDVTLQLRKRIAFVAENALSMVGCTRDLLNRCRGAPGT